MRIVARSEQCTPIGLLARHVPNEHTLCDGAVNLVNDAFRTLKSPMSQAYLPESMGVATGEESRVQPTPAR